jgi:hypothetical protein
MTKAGQPFLIGMVEFEADCALNDDHLFKTARVITFVICADGSTVIGHGVTSWWKSGIIPFSVYSSNRTRCRRTA